jgi:hypothetical protein
MVRKKGVHPPVGCRGVYPLKELIQGADPGFQAFPGIWHRDFARWHKGSATEKGKVDKPGINRDIIVLHRKVTALKKRGQARKTSCRYEYW